MRAQTLSMVGPPVRVPVTGVVVWPCLPVAEAMSRTVTYASVFWVISSPFSVEANAAEIPAARVTQSAALGGTGSGESSPGQGWSRTSSLGWFSRPQGLQEERAWPQATEFGYV